MNNIVYENIIKNISKSIKKALNEAFDFDSVKDSRVKRVKILSDIAHEEAKWIQLQNTDIIKVLEGLYGITKPRGFKVTKETIGNERKVAMPTIYTYNYLSKSDHEFVTLLKSKGFIGCKQNSYPRVMDGEYTIDEEIKNWHYYNEFKEKQYNLLKRKKITLEEYKQHVKILYDAKYKDIERYINEWQKNYDKLPPFAKQLFNEICPDEILISPDEGLLYLRVEDPNVKIGSLFTFTGKVLYIVDGLITDEESKKLNNDKKINNGKFACLNVALRKNKYTLACDTIKYMKDDKPTYLDFFDWDVSLERIKKKELQGKDIPYKAYQMELMTQRFHWHKVEPTHGAQFEYRTNDDLCYYRVYKKKDDPEFMEKFAAKIPEKNFVLQLRDTGNGVYIRDKMPNSYVEIGLVEERLKDYKYWQ